MPALRIVVIGPAPGSTGGIGMLMDHLEGTTSQSTTLTFVDSGANKGGLNTEVARAAAWMFVHRTEYDLAHVNLSVRGSTFRKLILTLVMRALRKPYILHLHSGAYDQFYSRATSWLKLSVRSMFRNAQIVLVLGEKWRHFVVDAGLAHSNKTIILPNAVPGPNELTDKSSTGCILFAGRLSANKGIPELLEAIKTIPSEIPFSLVLAGDVRDPSIIAGLADTAPNVITTGWLTQEQLARQLEATDIYVLPSHSEGLPMGLLDAMAWGLPSIVTTVGSIPDVVTPEEDAIVVSPGDVDGLQKALLRLLTDPDLGRTMGNNARQKWLARYKIDDYRHRLDRYYKLAHNHSQEKKKEI